MKELDKTDRRRKFLLNGLKGLLAGGIILSAAPTALASSKKTIKCLTEDGELVEVEVDDNIQENARSASTDEVKTWIHKK